LGCFPFHFPNQRSYAHGGYSSPPLGCDSPFLCLFRNGSLKLVLNIPSLFLHVTLLFDDSKPIPPLPLRSCWHMLICPDPSPLFFLAFISFLVIVDPLPLPPIHGFQELSSSSAKYDNPVRPFPPLSTVPLSQLPFPVLLPERHQATSPLHLLSSTPETHRSCHFLFPFSPSEEMFAAFNS